jgi:AcrR family transcriptional regulator
MQERVRRPTEERRKQIANEVLRILAEAGTAGLTAKNIGAAVGISDGAVFKHFESKDEIVDSAIDVFQSVMSIPKADPSTGSLENLRSFFVDRLALVKAHPYVLELAFSNSLENVAGPKGAARVRRTIARSVSFVRSCLREGQRSGAVVSTASASVLTWMVLGVLQAAAQRRAGKLTPDQIWSELVAVISEQNNTIRRST